MFTVYKVFDESGRLLYIGCTLDFQSRKTAHKRRFYNLQIYFEHEIFHFQSEAAKRERDLIAELKPAFNKTSGGYKYISDDITYILHRKEYDRLTK